MLPNLMDLTNKETQWRKYSLSILYHPFSCSQMMYSAADYGKAKDQMSSADPYEDYDNLYKTYTEVQKERDEL